MLKYIGNGSFIPGVPARNLSDEEASWFGVSKLLETGLYVEEKISKPGREDKLKRPHTQNKEGEAWEE
jgi:hypothetical protein